MIELTRKIIAAEMELVISRIQANIRNKKVTRFGSMNASGRTAASLHYEIDDKEVRLYGAKHIFRLETGSPPGTKVAISDIRMWIDEKPLAVQLTPRMNGTPRKHRDGSLITLEDKKNSLALLIRNAIDKRGTLLHQQGGNSGILKDVINSELENNLRKALFAEFEMIVTQQLLTAE